MRSLLVAALALPLAACWGAPGHLSFTGEPPGDNETWISGNDTGPEDTDGTYNDGVSPVIREADAWCYVTDDAGDWWGFEANGDDPQGSDTIKSYLDSGVTVLDSAGTTVANIALVCEANGQCWGSAQAEHIDIYCDNPQSYDFVFVIEDEQGHGSSGTTVPGRYGTGPTG